MALDPGTSHGPYEILAPLGAGGMGEVYRARDARLGRDVAIKVLPEAVTRDPTRLARFEREAKLLASLNHAGIATLHGLEEVDGEPFLVMELVEGETLADRISRGRIPGEEALPIARQIAEALEAAHERGVIHRDLKPLANGRGVEASSAAGGAPASGRHPSDGGTILYRENGETTGRDIGLVRLDGNREPVVLGGAYPNPGANYDVAPDGQRFAMVKPAEEAGGDTVVFLQNWLDELERLVPTD